MAKTRLQPGEDNIASRRVTDDPRGGYRLQWSIRLHDGRVLNKATRGKNMTKGQVKARAREEAARVLQSSGNTGKWSTLSSMSDYIRDESKVAVQSSSLAEGSKYRYLQILEYLAKDLDGYNIAEATAPERLEKTFNAMAGMHGTATAKQAKKVANKWVVKRLVFQKVISDNPLNNAGIEITVEHKAANKPEGGVAIPDGEYEYIIRYLLGLDPSDLPRKRRGRPASPEKRRSVIEVTMLQATTGLRISECRQLSPDDVREEAGSVYVTVRPEASKTKRGREVPILDGGVAARILERAQQRSGYALLFPSPDAPGHVWDKNNCTKAVNSFLQNEVARECDVPLLETHGSHIWRATLATRAAKMGVPPEIRAAYFGHSAAVDREYYTDLTDTSSFVAAMMKG